MTIDKDTTINEQENTEDNKEYGVTEKEKNDQDIEKEENNNNNTEEEDNDKQDEGAGEETKYKENE